MPDLKLHPTSCAICGTEDNAAELFPASFSAGSFNPDIFSARRSPDRIHYRLVKCNTCKLVRSDPVINKEILEDLYSRSSFNYKDETENLSFTYGRYLSRLDNYLPGKGSLLEIGCGSGFFLEQALKQSYACVKGVEPSALAVSKASPHVRENIICGIMRPGLFEESRFDAICMFQVLDHMADPKGVLAECLRILKPGGMVLCISHNIEAFSARLLKGLSPIIDIEHTYLYSQETIRKIFSVCNFQIKEAGPVLDRCTLSYLAKLLPMAGKLKQVFSTFLRGSPVGEISLSISLGNLYIIAQKPAILSG